MQAWWVDHKFAKGQTEAILCFVAKLTPPSDSASDRIKSATGDGLALCSNYPYELWADGVYVGDGGHRCPPGEAYIDRWSFQDPACAALAGAEQVVVRLHWMDVKSCSVWHRCLFPDPFFAELPFSSSSSSSPSSSHEQQRAKEKRDWMCYEDLSVLYKAKPCGQLPRQTFLLLGSPYSYFNPPLGSKLAPRKLVDVTATIIKANWRLVELPVKRSANVLVAQPRLLYDGALLVDGNGSGLFEPEEAEDLLSYVVFPTTFTASPPTAENKNSSSSKQKAKAKQQKDDTKKRTPTSLRCRSYDLGLIALHRFEIRTPAYAILCYSEVADFATAWATENRSKVHLADGVEAHDLGRLEEQRGEQKEIWAAPFGHRGCRYLHVLTPSYHNGPVVFRAYRREYPFDWIEEKSDDDHQKDKREEKDVEKAILAACRRNLIACVDGGLVDTCWRERAQWTGDARMAMLALQRLTRNPEVGALVLRQISQSYDPATGMVNGCWPAKKPNYAMPMPTYHLAFCLAAVENGLESECQVVRRSVQFWREHYVSAETGLLQGMPGWYFVDWDGDDCQAIGRGADLDDQSFANSGYRPEAGHAVCTAWWIELCDRLGIDSGVRPDAFVKAYWTGQAFSMFASNSKSSNASPHATAAVLSSITASSRFFPLLPAGLLAGARAWLAAFCGFDNEDGKEKWATLRRRVTAYFAYFVAKSLGADAGRQFARRFYGPIASRYGTIYEKCDADASLAHGWSVAVATLF
jgi:hypothetical protein